MEAPKETPQFGGPVDAKLVLLGEAPSGEEIRRGRPFAGMPGEVLDDCLAAAGVEREDCRIINIWPWPVSKDKKTKTITGRWDGQPVLWTPTKGFTAAGWEAAAAAHVAIKNSIGNGANMVAALGLTALSMIDPGLRSGRERWGGLISRWRGSVWRSSVYDVKVTATYHPADVVWGATENRHTIAGDLRKAGLEADFPEIRRRQRDLIIAPSRSEITKAVERVFDERRLWFDIEMFNGQLSAFGFTTDPSWAICIPFVGVQEGSHRWTTRDEHWVIKQLAMLLENADIEKGNQNILFDIWTMLWAYGIHTWGRRNDPMVLHHIVFPDHPKTLAYQASWLTDLPYWKDDAGKKAWMTPWENAEQFWRYNCLDVVAACECWEGLSKQYLGPDSPYARTYEETMEMIDPLAFMMLRGVRVDARGMQRSRDEQVKKQREALQRCRDAGLQNPLSSQQCSVFFFGKPGHVANKFALLRFVRQGGVLGKVAEDALEVRRSGKQVSNYFEMPLVAQRMMTSYDIRGTNTGRLSSSGSVLGGGANEQNLTSEFTRWLVPDGWEEEADE